MVEVTGGNIDIVLYFIVMTEVLHWYVLMLGISDRFCFQEITTATFFCINTG